MYAILIVQRCHSDLNRLFNERWFLPKNIKRKKTEDYKSIEEILSDDWEPISVTLTNDANIETYTFKQKARV